MAENSNKNMRIWRAKNGSVYLQPLNSNSDVWLRPDGRKIYNPIYVNPIAIQEDIANQYFNEHSITIEQAFQIASENKKHAGLRGNLMYRTKDGKLRFSYPIIEIEPSLKSQYEVEKNKENEENLEDIEKSIEEVINSSNQDSEHPPQK